MDVFAITHNTRPESIKTYSTDARKQVVRLIAALAHHEQDQDDISLARVAEAQHGLVRVMALDEAMRNLSDGVDKALRLVQDKFYKLQDDLQDLTPAGARYHVPQSRGTTSHVQSQGQAKLPRSTSPASVSASGSNPTGGNVRPTGAGTSQPTTASTAQPAESLT